MPLISFPKCLWFLLCPLAGSRMTMLPKGAKGNLGSCENGQENQDTECQEAKRSGLHQSGHCDKQHQAHLGTSCTVRGDERRKQVKSRDWEKPPKAEVLALSPGSEQQAPNTDRSETTWADPGMQGFQRWCASLFAHMGRCSRCHLNRKGKLHDKSHITTV